MTKYNPLPTNKFKKDYKLLKKRGYDMSLLQGVITKLANGETLPPQNCDHPLKGNRKGYRDCHIKGDWILIYKIDEGVLTLILSETGTHSGILR
jgi:mRNA interferase YafQ